MAANPLRLEVASSESRELHVKKKAEKLFEDPHHRIDFSSLHFGPLIGNGGFSSVFIGRYQNNLIAIKKQDRTKEIPEKYLLQELAILSKLKPSRHPNIITYYGAHDEISQTGGLHSLYIVLEYCQGGDLLHLILDKFQPLSWFFRVNLASQASNAILYMHKHNILHRDIKSANFMLDSKWNIKLSDFGASRAVQDTSSPTRASITTKKQAMTICGTDNYAAPEILFQEDYCAAIDVFSLGMVIYELIKRSKVGENGFIERKPQNKFDIDVELTQSQLPSDAPSSFVLLAHQCTLYEYDQRPSAQDVFDWLHDLSKDLPNEDIIPPLMKDAPVF